MGIHGAPIHSLQPPGIKSGDTIGPQFGNSRADFFKPGSKNPPGAAFGGAPRALRALGRGIF